MSDAEWGPWIEHDGKGCPVPVGTMIEMEAASPSGVRERAIVVVRNAAQRLWVNPNAHGFCIICYRIRKPRGLTILENLITDLPATASPKVDA